MLMNDLNHPVKVSQPLESDCPRNSQYWQHHADDSTLQQRCTVVVGNPVINPYHILDSTGIQYQYTIVPYSRYVQCDKFIIRAGGGKYKYTWQISSGMSLFQSIEVREPRQKLRLEDVCLQHNSHIDRALRYSLTSHLITRSIHRTGKLNMCFFAVGYNSLTLSNLEPPSLIKPHINCSVLVALIPFLEAFTFVLQLYNPWVPIPHSVAHRPIGIEDYWRSSVREFTAFIARYYFSVFRSLPPRNLLTKR